MKIYQILIILSLIIFIKNIEFCDLVVSATGPEDCKNLLKASYVNYCCFFKGKWKGQDYSACMDITPIRYNEMDNYIKEMNSQNGYNGNYYRPIIDGINFNEETGRGYDVVFNYIILIISIRIIMNIYMEIIINYNDFLYRIRLYKIS